MEESFASHGAIISPRLTTRAESSLEVALPGVGSLQQTCLGVSGKPSRKDKTKAIISSLDFYINISLEKIWYLENPDELTVKAWQATVTRLLNERKGKAVSL